MEQRIRPLCALRLWKHKYEIVNFTDHSVWFKCERKGCSAFKIEKLGTAPKDPQ